MDEIEDFFNFSKEFKRTPTLRGTVSGNAQATAQTVKSFRPEKRPFLDDDYARDIAIEERLKMESMDITEFENNRASTSRQAMDMDNLDEMEDFSDDEQVEQQRNRIYNMDDGVYSRYNFTVHRDTNLPIFEARDRILEAIKRSPVVILEGDTGCGKTTQVPQYILDEAYRNNVYCKICVTQPRRIAAISIAARVSKERNWQTGKVVGYKVGLRQCVSEDTRITFCTTGVLLQHLINEKSLNQYTHIILDEVHERDQDMDFLLIVVRRLLATVSKHVKVILMSATIDTTEFANYFRLGGKPAPVIRVVSRRMFTVKEFYLDNLQRINKDRVKEDSSNPTITREMFQLALKLVLIIGNIEIGELQDNPAMTDVNASILIFLPGINEINELAKLLEHLNEQDTEQKIKLFPIRLHSMISPEEQNKVFHRAANGYRKVILATNIAESSITVPDVKYVIDFCLTKSLVSTSNFSSLVLHWASRANCRQRAGRAGRVMNGRVYRLVSKSFYFDQMPEFGIPEMLRCPLENVVLKSKLLEMGPPPDILGLAMSPPNLSDIQNTILTLKEVGALFKTVDGRYTMIDGDLTYMGRIMAALPLDIRLSRLIMLGYMFSTLEEAIIIAAGLSVRSIFVTMSKYRPADPFIQKLLWADASGSDLFAIFKAYKVWSSMCEQGNFRCEEDEISWAKRFFINLRAIKEMHLLVQELTERLSHVGIKKHNAYQRVFWLDRELSIVLKVVIAGAFYPNYFTRSNIHETDRERTMYHMLCGRDPCNTVYFTKFNTRFIGQLYAGAIKNLFKDVHIPAKDIEVNFQPGSERVFVTFTNNISNDGENSSGVLMVPGRVVSEVYKAIRMRMENMNTTIRVMDPHHAIRFAEQQGIGRMVEGAWQPKEILFKNPELIVIPSVFQRKVRVHITHIENCSKFFARPCSEFVRFNDITSQLNCHEIDKCQFENPADINKGMNLAAPFMGKYHRARVIGPMPGERNKVQFKVYYIDWGNISVVEFEELRRFPKNCETVMDDMPPLIFECRLANIQPSTMNTSRCCWQDEAMEILQCAADKNPTIDLVVYSVVSFVVNVILESNDGSSLNEILIKKGLARATDESYMSKIDHDLRKRKQSFACRFVEDDHAKQNEEYIRTMQLKRYVECDVPANSCARSLQLRGPYSPCESNIYSAIRIGTWKTVSIERDSVNSCMIDSDPQDTHERLIVAASVTESSEHQGRMTARATTLMPNIHGYGALVTMLFCPTMQLKCNKAQTKYVSILAGLGYNQVTMKPYFEEHDIVLTLDVDIDEVDMQWINHLRYCMDTILYTSCRDDQPPIDEKTRNELQAKIKTLIINLFEKNRQYIEPSAESTDYIWQRLTPEMAKGPENCYGARSIFPPHLLMDLMEEKFETLHRLNKHCTELHDMSTFDALPQEEVRCRLCNIPLENITQLRIHLLSQLHRDREMQIKFKSPKA